MLETKFYLPPRRRGLVPRVRLTERLDRGAESRLTLVCAPPGFGKTTLVSHWLDEWTSSAPDQRLGAWLSLDMGDNRPASFWAYVAGALQRVLPGASIRLASQLNAALPAPVEAVLVGLLNELSEVQGDVVLVLDDYHVVDNPEIHSGVMFLVDHLPPQVHLVIASRSDPPLPLARLRARSQLTEVRSADLRFTTAESGAYLTQALGQELSVQDVAALGERTEGWAAALQLAALSMQGRSDIPEFIAGFAGDDRFIVDYLAEEVLERLPGPVHSFLLRTSILSRLTGPLCDALTEKHDGRAMLEELERANLFLIPLDDRRRWYRYHHLFADVLLTRLVDQHPDQVPQLHRRASVWFEHHGDPAAAIDHALLARDLERAADLVELTARDMHRDRQESVVRSWLAALPPELARVRPVLSIVYAADLMVHGESGGVEAYLRAAEAWLGPDPPRGQMVVANHEEFQRVPASIALYRAGQALIRGDGPATIQAAQQVLDLSPGDDHVLRGSAFALLGLAAWLAGELDRGHCAYVESTSQLLQAGHIADTMGIAIAMADIRITQGRLDDALGTYRQALANSAAGRVLRGTADMHVGMSEILRERNDLDAALAQLSINADLGEYNGLPQNAYRWRMATAGVLEAQGDVDGALALLREAESAYVGDFSPNVRPVGAVRARLLARQGRADEALSWAQEQGLAPDDDLSYLREFSHLTLARALLASVTQGDRGPARAALELLGRLLAAAQAGQRKGNVLEILIVQALAHRVLGDVPAALGCVQRALTLGEPQEYVRIFADDGEPIRELLKGAARQHVTPGYVRRILAALGAPPGDRCSVQPDLIDPLSERELHVLRLLATELSGPEIARELTVSLNTVRTHTKNIFTKLGVGTRRAAVARAHALGLLPMAR